MITAVSIVEMLEGCSWIWSSEEDLQDSIEELLNQEGIKYKREYVLGDSGRVDFMIEDRIALEVKVDGGITSIYDQMTRYAAHDEVEELVLATTQASHRETNRKNMHGRPVRVAFLSAGMG